MNSSDIWLYFIVGLIFIVFVVFLIVAFSVFATDFTREYRYLSEEIQRSTGEERRSWIKKRRRLILSLIPFVKY